MEVQKQAKQTRAPKPSYSSSRKRLGEILLSEGVIDLKDLWKALNEQRTTGERIGKILAHRGVDAQDIAKALSNQLDLPMYEGQEPVKDVSGILSSEYLSSRIVFPMSRDGRTIRVLMANPLDTDTISEMGFLFSSSIKPIVATPQQILQLIESTYFVPSEVQSVLDKYDPSQAFELLESLDEEDETQTQDIDKTLDDKPIVRMVNIILYWAVDTDATDIHIEAAEKETLVRYRIDGMLQTRHRFPKKIHQPLISRLKVMADMDIAIRRRPQDGAAKIRIKGRKIDLRLSSLPSQYGEKMVIRLLGNSTKLLTLRELGMSPAMDEQLRTCLHKPQGLILTTGPTGSGKSTTLYASLKEVISEEISVVTVEDPIEYEIPGANQVQVNAKAGVTFANGLRAILRQDPNVIMVGEIRDMETAEIAFRASLTGHLVLSTLHANSSISAVTRLVDMQIKPYLIASSSLAFLGQRLLRRNCQACIEEYEPPAESLERLGILAEKLAGIKYMHGAGCEKCHFSGYSGRIGTYEILMISEEIQELIRQDATEQKILKAATSAGMVTMEEYALEMVAMGITTVEEALRVVPP
ncbi:Putative type II secretion system protein E [Desulfatibacillum aliphaticivorans]|uniref:Type II secretion system protein E n=1 Tax=Desulfatibacillum aliphaticivorans TaxID=218208 RepID=B8FI02_DESAL|nr:GspE/PulE family protein [Desulfatibacillum aliphaticivorans]ACL02569.1 Putative type II secretion system protein E [Desulfatibacillum aliphaticivorans]